MRTLLEQTFERTLDAWVHEWTTARPRPRAVQAWVFEGAEARRAAEERLRAAGIEATLHSSYKPLLHFFLEAVDRTGLARVCVRYPVHPHAAPLRFRMETFPLHELLPGVALRWEALPASDAPPAYEVTLAWHDGRTQAATVPAPSRVHPSPLGHTQLSPTAWRTVHQADGRVQDEARACEATQLFDAAMACLRGHPWPVAEPYFERLRIDVAMPGPAALQEAMHEDLYFSLLEFFQQHSGRPHGDRRLQPGQIAPFVRPSGDGPVSLRIALQPHPAIVATAHAAVAVAAAHHESPLADADAPLPAHRVDAALAGIGGQRFEAATRQGRRVVAVHRAGTGTRPAVFISGGQHANETSGVVGALRAAQQLQQDPEAHFAVLPLENPDGYALHAELCALAPTQMHHAARYSALGDDIEYREAAPLREREAREWALATSGAALHVNLHGYPAHEWTRPFNGYVPQGFELWTIPKGFFLIMRHHAGWLEPARQLLEAVCLALARDAGLMAFNAAQVAAYKRYRDGDFPFEELHGTVYKLQEMTTGAPLTLVTEFPDQTLQGEAFTFAQQAQTRAALAAVAAFDALAQAGALPGPSGKPDHHLAEGSTR